MEMTANDMMAEIRDANLSYLMLAQQMIRATRSPPSSVSAYRPTSPT
jgi:hypothetical protein